ncbi:MAG: YchF/TatD family DNA exonuclease [Gammaproteobacteria bacterium]|nr:YchF/TatD family DNA exonuclease [Gammaproteobacteria bacterium]
MQHDFSLIDSHCHLNCLELEKLGTDLDGVLAEARGLGVNEMLCVSIDLETLPEVLDIARRYPKIHASVGVHPNVSEGEDPDLDTLLELAREPSVIAIGETGLDYFRSSDEHLEVQRRRFRTHIGAAKVSRKPLIIHSREADDDTIRVLREEGAENAGGIMHCFASDWALARAALDLGFYISFSGIITFKSADSLREVAAKVPADRLLIETDSPYLAPVPHRGRTNQPAYVRYVAEALARIRGTDLQTIARQTSANFHTLFFPG